MVQAFHAIVKRLRIHRRETILVSCVFTGFVALEMIGCRPLCCNLAGDRGGGALRAKISDLP